MLRQFMEDFTACDSRGRGGNLTEMQQQYHQLWLQIAPFQLHRNRRLHASVIGFRSNPGAHTLLSPNRPIAKLHEVQMLSYTPIDQDCVVSRRGKPRRQNFREHFEIRSAFCENGDVWFSNRNALPWKVIQADGSLQPRQDHPVAINKHYGHVAGGGLGDLVAEARAETKAENDTIVAPISGKLSVVRDELWYHLMIDGVSCFRVPLKQSDAFAFTAEKVENPELVAGLNKSRVTKGEILTRLSRPVEYLATVFENGEAKFVFMGGDTLPASRHLDRLSFVLEAKARVVEYSDCVEFGRTMPEEALLDFEERFPRFLLELPASFVATRWDQGWRPNADFRLELLNAVNAGELDDYLPEMDKPVASYELLTRQVGEEAMPHLEDIFFDSVVVKSGTKGWFGEGICVDYRFLNQATLAKAADLNAPMWLDFSAMAGFYDGEVAAAEASQPELAEYVNGWYICPAMPLDLANGLTRKVKGVNYDFQPGGQRFTKLAQKLAEKNGLAPVLSPEEREERPRRSTERPARRDNRRRQSAGNR